MTAPLRVLIVEDVESDAALVDRELTRAGYTTVTRRVEIRTEMMAALTNDTWDVVISDYSLPAFDAPSALRLLKEMELDLPFIIVSGTIGEDVAVAAMKAGAHDYLVKGRLKRLVPAVERELREAAARREAKEASRALRESEERFRIITKSTTDVIWDWDLTTGEIWMSQALKRGYGHTVTTVTAQWRTDHIHPDDRERVMRGMHRIIHGAANAWTEHYRFRRFDGTYSEVLDRGYVLRGTRGGAKRMLGSMMDLTSFKRAEEGRRRAEESFRTLIDGSPDPIAIIHEGVIVRANRAVAALFGHASSDLLSGHPVSDLVAEVDAERMSLVCSSDGRPQLDREFRVLTTDRRSVDVEVSSIPMVLERTPAALLLIRDITERKQMSAKMMQMDRLAAIGTLAAGVGHEINNPLAFMIANLQYLEDELAILREESRRLADASGISRRVDSFAQVLADTNEGAMRIKQIVQDLRTFSRADEETRTLVDVQRVIDSSLSMAALEIKHRAHVVRLYGNPPPVFANEARLGQVFLNLVINAAQAMPEGSASTNVIRIRTAYENGAVVVEVSDTGKGIDPEHLPHVFEPFFTTKPIGQGTGLGLAICRQTVRSMRGEIRVASTPGMGSVFTVTVAAAPPSALVSPEEAVALPPPSTRAKILYVDDEPMLGTAMRRLLREHDIVAVCSAQEALERVLRGEHFDVMLCDLMMPDMTGMELFHEVERVRPDLAQRTVFLTGGAFTPSASEFLAHTAPYHLDKPVDATRLRAVIGAYLRGEPVHKRASWPAPVSPHS